MIVNGEDESNRVRSEYGSSEHLACREREEQEG